MTGVPSQKRPVLAIVGTRALRLALLALPLAAIANIGFFLWSLDGRSLVQMAVQPPWLILALLFSFLPWLTNSLRLLIWSRFFELKLSLRQIARIILGTVLGNAVTPTASGAPAVKWAFLVNEGVTPDKAATLIGIQAAEDSFASMILLAIALVAAITLEVPALFPGIDWMGSAATMMQRTALTIVAISAVLGLSMAAAFGGLFGGMVKQACRNLVARLRSMFSNAARDWKYAFRAGRKSWLASTILAVIQWTARHSIAALVIGFVGGQMMPMLHWALQWLTITASSIIPSPGGAGGTEAAFLLFFAPFLPGNVLGPAMVIWRTTIFYIPVIVAGLIFLMLGWHKPVMSAQRVSIELAD